MIEKVKALLLGHKKLSILIGGILILAIIGWNVFAPKSAAPVYQTAQVTKGTLISSVTASGAVNVSNKVSITTAASGVVQEIFVKSGDSVNQGDKIAQITLDNAGQQRQTAAYAAYLAAQNTLNSDTAAINTLQVTLFKTNQAFVTDRGVANPTDQQKADPVYIEEDAAWLAAEAAYKNQQSVIAKDQASVSNAFETYQSDSATVTAPASGTITDVQIAPGMQIGSSTSTSTTTTNLQNVANIKRDGQMSVVVDTAEMYLGSANLTGAGLGAKADGKRNFEMGIWTRSTALIESVLEQFNTLWEGHYCKKCRRKDICPVPLEEPELVGPGK